MEISGRCRRCSAAETAPCRCAMVLPSMTAFDSALRLARVTSVDLYSSDESDHSIYMMHMVRVNDVI